MAEAKRIDAQEMAFRSHRMLKKAVDLSQELEWEISASTLETSEEKKPITIAAACDAGRKLKVAAYCRVSTVLDSQESSIESQHKHYERLIRSNDEWQLAGIYLETGVTGTKKEKRPELQRLIEDCKAGKIDLILTKSISRFARNTSDCLEIVRVLSALGVVIRFDKEKIDTGTMESEFLLSIFACLAEDESHSISGNMKWAIRKQFETGTYKQVIAPYGYEYDGKKLVIVPERADVVKRMFRMALSGDGLTSIARQLNTEGIPSPSGKKWTQEAIRVIFNNPAYIGDMLYQKTYKDEHFRQRRNKGELDQYYDEDHHEPIISREDYENAQAVIRQRAAETGYKDGADRNRGNKRYCFSGILFCKECGDVMHRQEYAEHGTGWICHTHARQPERCRMKPVHDVDIRAAFLNCLNKLAWSQRRMAEPERVLDVYSMMQEKTAPKMDIQRLETIDSLLEENHEESRKLSSMILKDHYMPEHLERQSFLIRQENDLLAERERLMAPAAELQYLKRFISGWKTTDNTDDFPEEIFRDLVEKCTVDTQKSVTFHFRCGLELTESIYRTEEP